MCEILDIYSDHPYPSGALSNFAEYRFTIDGISCAGMEGFLQSLKYFSRKKQKEVCSLFGRTAKKAGQDKKLWKRIGLVHWNGKLYRRQGQAFAALIERAYREMYAQCPDFRQALADSRGITLAHTVGSHDKKQTILTEEEFIYQLNQLRENNP